MCITTQQNMQENSKRCQRGNQKPYCEQGQTIQWPKGQTMQWPKGQTIQWPKGQTIQWPKGQTIQWPKENVQKDKQ